MTCDATKDDTPCDGCEECGDYIPLCSETDISRSIDFAVSVLADIDNNIASDIDLDNVTVSINANMLAGICGALLEYAEIEGVDVHELFEMNAAERLHGVNRQTKPTIH